MSAFQKIVIEFQHPRADAAGCAWRAEEKNARKTHRQFHPRLAILDRRGSGGEHLQRAVKKHRMQRILARTARDHIGQAPRVQPSRPAPADSSRIGRNSSP